MFVYFFGTFAKLRKVNTYYLHHVCLSIGRIFIKFDIRVFFENLPRKFYIKI
jgi:hypothetical protein